MNEPWVTASVWIDLKHVIFSKLKSQKNTCSITQFSYNTTTTKMINITFTYGYRHRW